MKGLNLILLTAVISGFSIFLNKFGVSVNNAYAYTFVKNSMTFILVFGFILLLNEARKFKELKFNDWKKLIAIGFIGGSVPFLLFFRGLQLTNAAKASFIHKLMFVFVAVMAYYYLKEKFSWKVFAASGLLILGNALLLKLSWQPFNLGDLMIFGATAFWAVENVISKNALKNIPGNIVAFSRMFFGSLFILAFLLVTGDAKVMLTMTSQQWLWAIVPSILLTVYVLTWYNGLKDTSVTLATAVLLLGSPITTMLNFIQAGAIITAWQAMGMVMLVLGVIGFTYAVGKAEIRKAKVAA